ncbi:CENP-C, partial [Trifolium pratense]
QALPNSGKLVEQGKSILEDNLGFSTEKSTQDVGNSVVASEEGEEFPRNRRLDLELSLRPTKNPSVEDLLPSLDMKNLEGPTESNGPTVPHVFHPVDDNTVKGKGSRASLDVEETGSVAIEENKLDETASCDSFDQAMKLLKGMLHHKPIILEDMELSPSNFPGYQVIDLRPFREGLLNLKQREELSVIDNWLNTGTVIETPKWDDVVSHTPPKRP